MEWKEHSDDSLIAYAQDHPQQAEPAAMEMQRRLLVAIRAFNATSTRQAAVMIRLTWVIAALTVAALGMAGLQLWAMRKFPPATAAARADGVLVRDESEATGWVVESYAGGVMTARHAGAVYTARCSESTFFNKTAETTQADDALIVPCTLPTAIVGRVVQPLEGRQKDADGNVFGIGITGRLLLIQRRRDEPSPWRMDTFIITSVIAKR